MAFQLEFLLSPSALNRFLSGNDEIAAMAQTVHTAKAQGRSWGPDLDQAYYWITGYFLTVGSYLLSALCMGNLSKRVWVQSRHALQYGEVLKAENLFQHHLLAKSINTHRLDSASQYLLPPLTTTLSTHPTSGQLNLFHSWGVCRGMSYWFIHLYFKTRSSFSNADLQLAAVGKQFEQGAPQQAVLLHALDPSSVYDLLRLGVREDYSKISPHGKTEEQIIGSIRSNPPGIYGIYTSSHQVVYIKVDASREYLFDPKVGIIKISTAALFKTAMEDGLQSHNTVKEILIDQYTVR